MPSINPSATRMTKWAKNEAVVMYDKCIGHGRLIRMNFGIEPGSDLWARYRLPNMRDRIIITVY